MIFADHLSRNIGMKELHEPTCKGLDIKIQDVYLNTSDEKCVSLAGETDKDGILVTLKNMIIKGWPDMRDNCPQNLRKFGTYWDELSILDGLVLKGVRIVIPKQCKAQVLEKLHEGHFGIEWTKLRARDTVYWLEINKDIEALIRTCEICQEHGHRNNKDIVLAREIPFASWTLVEIDIFTCEDHTFLLTVDVTSRFPVVRIISSETTRSVLNAIKGIYSNFGCAKESTN